MSKRGGDAKYMERKDRKDRVIRFRVSDEQRRILAEAANRAGADLSTWVRITALNAAQLARA